MKDYYLILKKYWGYNTFRPLQEDIIASVCNGEDTLALMPTGGGKSITFQVPALAMDGLCLVITPLIALMKDQVENLKKKNINAVAVYTGLTKQEIKTNIDKCIYGDVKFLYISPERLASKTFKIKLQQMNVCFIAVDEAHCISEWGYDFRPSYLKIAEIRDYFPNKPILALTATATPEVVNDIQEKLSFYKKNVLQKSFERKNLTYVVRFTENKEGQLISILKKIPGCGIVYVRNRKRAKEIADFLVANNIKAGFYHAGLSYMQRNARQESWMKNRFRIMVATNAFGMGIDKPDVRVVVHFHIPDTIEAYFQEAGRAGRDGERSYAVLMWDPSDEEKLKQRIETNYPKKDIVKKVYVSLGNYLQIQEGEGQGFSYKFNLADFSRLFKFNALQAYSSLKILQRSGYIELTDEVNKPTSLMFISTRDDLYDYKSVDEKEEELIKLLLRTYTGLFSGFTHIDEEYLAEKLGTNVEKIWDYLKIMSKQKMIKVIPRLKTPYVFYSQPRLPVSYIKLSTHAYRERKKRYIKRIKAIWKYVSFSNKCRSQLLLQYFGQTKSTKCGRCDVCIAKNRKKLSSLEMKGLKEQIVTEIKKYPVETDILVDNIDEDKKFVIDALKMLLEEDKIHYKSTGELDIKS